MTRAPAGDTRSTLAARHPEYAPWLALHDIARAAFDDPAWASAVPAPAAAPPFVDGVIFAVDTRPLERLVHAVFERAEAQPPPDPHALLEAAIAETAHATDSDDDGDGVAVTAAAFAAMPLLHACRRAWQSQVPESWIDAACPVCGAWAALVEARGLERRLRHRCGRCGADWPAEPVRCAFCGLRDHARLTTLVSERAEERGRVDACTGCRGYLKTITTLAACPPDEVELLDLETVPLDIAALEHEFQRPPPRPRRITVRPKTSRTARLGALLRGRG